ncbi:hypothetical protein BDK51DRAFT_50348 [Blyttiomyces helicus]|uniref:AB hydrolase-1 domain-containing protein n=1 Tax=Blyttiomyces helicus TaxID=388810 RepID=A0A4P9VXL1_9FUNG|nr:hypothetical protein BDK51DRAFT_50348 [Blyttiomyces helicus]|eukprot:RKO83040.1 hypothetical protein BDK51DRAFT_50348 [Blyttiomyces helicus]
MGPPAVGGGDRREGEKVTRVGRRSSDGRKNPVRIQSGSSLDPIATQASLAAWPRKPGGLLLFFPLASFASSPPSASSPNPSKTAAMPYAEIAVTRPYPKPFSLYYDIYGSGPSKVVLIAAWGAERVAAGGWGPHGWRPDRTSSRIADKSHGERFRGELDFNTTKKQLAHTPPSPLTHYPVTGKPISSHQSWDFQFEHFANRSEYSCLVFDNRGVGLSDCPEGRYTTSEMAKDTYELLVYLGWKSNVHVVGVSMAKLNPPRTDMAV